MGVDLGPSRSGAPGEPIKLGLAIVTHTRPGAGDGQTRGYPLSCPPPSLPPAL